MDISSDMGRHDRKMSVKANFLLISDLYENAWLPVIKEALAPFETFDVIPEDGAVGCVEKRHYDVIIMDATAIGEVPLLIIRVRERRPDARIVVVTASPTWWHARETFRAGAVDYIYKSMSPRELHATFAPILARLGL